MERVGHPSRKLIADVSHHAHGSGVNHPLGQPSLGPTIPGANHPWGQAVGDWSGGLVHWDGAGSIVLGNSWGGGVTGRRASSQEAILAQRSAEHKSFLHRPVLRIDAPDEKKCDPSR